MASTCSRERGPVSETQTDQLLRSYTYNTGNVFHQPDAVVDYVNATTTYTTTYTYDASTRQLTGIARPNGITTTYSYDSSSKRLTGISDQPINASQSFTYYANGLVHTHTDERGLIRTFTWDNLQRMTRIDFPGTPVTSVSYSYTRSGGQRILDLTSFTDRLGKVTSFDRTGLRQMIWVKDAMNPSRQTWFGYCGCGALETITNPLGEVTRLSYDNAGRITRVTYASGVDDHSINYTYNLLGQLTAIRDHSGTINVATYTYNNQGLPSTLSSPYGQQVSVTYDIKDRPTTKAYAGGPTATQTFDFLDRLLTRALAGGGTESFGYSALGLTSYTDQPAQSPRTTLFNYDLANRRVTVTDAKGLVTTEVFDASLLLTSLTDAMTPGRTTTWDYDTEGRLRSKSDPGGQAVSYTYDANGRMLTRLFRGQSTATQFTYDNVGNLLSVNYPNSPDLTFTYDALNRLASVSDSATGTSTFTFTHYGTLAGEDGPWSTDGITYGDTATASGRA